MPRVDQQNDGGSTEVNDDAPLFRPFNPNSEHWVYVRHLPHWRQPGATYFVTFRQNDSVPESVVQEWLDLRQRWYHAHGLDPQLKLSQPRRFDTSYSRIPEGVRRAFENEQARLLHVELDRSYGSCLLQHKVPADQVCESLAYFHSSRLWLGDFVVMPNHIHAIVQPKEGWELEDLFGSIKKFTARTIGTWLLTQPQSLRPALDNSQSGIWQRESYDHIIRDVDELAIFRRYIASNPRDAKIEAGQFRYFAADWLDKFADRPDSLQCQP